MKVTFDVKELQKRLSEVGLVVAKKASEIIYNHVRLFTKDGAVKFLGTDIDSTMTVTLPSAKADGDVDVVLLYEKLSQAVQNLTAKEATISVADTTATLTSGKFKAVIRTFPVQKFIDLGTVQALADKPALGGIEFPLPGLKDQIDNVAFAIAPADGKNVVSGAKIESGNGVLRLAATDGYRLVISDTAADYGTADFLIPKPALDLIQKMDGGSKMVVSESEGVYFFETELELLTYSKIHVDGNALVTGAYKGVIPKETYPSKVIFKDKDALLSALNRVRPFADKDKQGVVFQFTENGTVAQISALHEESGTDGAMFRNMGEDEVEVEVQGPANNTKTDLKLLDKYLEKAIYPITMHVRDNKGVLDFWSNGSTNYRFLLMPMRQE